ncbi:MAG TPA: hypothetical protein VNZ63_09920 [Verrucomicrobiae bacterium]|nr:hypothetical protein [Verrucomicrobiae bacterium]
MKRFARSLRFSRATRRALSSRRSPEARLGSLLAAILTLVAALGLASCGAAPTSTAITCSTTTSSSSSTTSTSTCTDPVTNISITISPATVSVNVVTEQQFQVSIQGGTNSIPTWEVNGVQGGSDAAGHIDSNGLYHAPVAQPTPNTVTVSVGTSQDPQLSASSTVTITPAPVVSITWNVNSTTCTNSSTSTSAIPSCPTPTTSGTANTATFTASETGGVTNTIVWSVGPVGGLPIEGGNSTLGTINANGVFSAPATPPIGQVVTVTASAQDSPTSSASLDITISGYSPSSLQGQFVFSLSGSNASGHFFRAGSFTADSAGTLSSVVEDVNPAPGGTGNPIIRTGAYTLGLDGRGQLSFNDGLTPAKFDFVLVNSGQLQIIGFDSSGTASGQANAQDASTFSAPLSALNGIYVFDFSGVHGANALSQIGEFAADGAGNITLGLIDTNDGGTTSAAPFQIYGSKTPCTPSSPPALSSYAVSANGRGTLTLNTVDSTCATGPSYVLTFYVVSRGGAKFVGTDSVRQVGGYTSQQTPGATFNLSTLGGSFAFLLAGSGPGGPLATAGNFAPDGSGHLASGVLDENVNGTPAANLAFQPNGTNVGTYTLASNGRGTLTFATTGRTYRLVFYLGQVGTNTTAVLQETDSGIASDGNFTLQQSAAFTLASILSNYAIQTSSTSGGLLQVITGQVGADGAGAIKAGSVVDINTGGTTLTPPAGQTVTGSYTAPAASGRSVLTLSPINPVGYAAYVVNPSEVYLLGIQPGQLAAGVLLRQF